MGPHEPYISSGSNSYKISGVLQEGEQNAEPKDHTVTKIEVNGRRSCVLSLLTVSSGLGSGRYPQPGIGQPLFLEIEPM